MTESEPAKSVPLTEVNTALGRARCPQATQLKRMRQSLSRHGQMTPVVVVERQGKLELVDGFKRRAAALQMNWTHLRASVRPLDQRAQWVAMLILNHTPGSLSVMEEALILRELVRSGLTQVEVGELVGRHKSWVSRRLGLVEKLHPELVEWVRTGLMSPGTARRLFVLPAGNQLEMAAVVTQQDLSTQETELLVSLWHKTSDPKIRSFLLKEPRKALVHARPDVPRTPVDPRLTARGQTLQRSLRLLQGVSTRVVQMLRPPPVMEDLEILSSELNHLGRLLPTLTEVVGTARKSNGSEGRNEMNETPSFDSCSTTGTASEPPPGKPASM